MISNRLTDLDYTRLIHFWNAAQALVPEDSLPKDFLMACEKALKERNWKEVGEYFRKDLFLGKDGYFILVGPYRTIRAGKEEVCPLGIVGQVLPHPDYSYLSGVASSFLGVEIEPALSVRPVRVFSALGRVSHEGGEAFLVPDGWRFEGSEEGAALNDMPEQRRRFSNGAKPVIRKVFELASAELLIGAVESSSPEWGLQHREFEYHEVGHASGLGLRRKLREDLLPTPWYRGVEEWRADGIAFELMARTLSPLEAGKTIAANFALRFGVDAQRAGGMERDMDVSASLLTFESLFTSGSFQLGPNRKLEFINPSYEGLLQSTEKMRYDTLRVTRDESSLTFAQGLWGLYGSLQVTSGSRRLFQGLVIDPCAGIFSSLR